MERGSRLTEAICLAARAHAGQTDKAGEPYILHPLRVMQAVSPEARVVAVLHDVIEDTAAFCTGGEVVFGSQYIELGEDEWFAIDMLTRDGQPYATYIAEIAEGQPNIEAEVKIADLRDNLSRHASLPDSLRKRYERALRTLGAAP